MWEESSDPNGDVLTYSLFVCENEDFSDCAPVSVAARIGLGVASAATGPAALLVLLALGGPGARRRRGLARQLARVGVVAALGVAALAGCSGGSSGDAGGSSTPSMRERISGLSPATTYYWKVVASDGTYSTESAVRSFTTR